MSKLPPACKVSPTYDVQYSVPVPLKIPRYEAISTKEPVRLQNKYSPQEAQLSQISEVFRCRIHLSENDSEILELAWKLCYTDLPAAKFTSDMIFRRIRHQ